MSQPARRRATYQDVVDAPDHMVAEILAGELHTSPRPASRHAVGASGVHGELHSPFQKGRGGPGGWWILFEPELHLGDDVLIPDVGGWRRERMPTVPDVAAFALAPDWVCEVVSPSTGRIDRVKKLPIYAREGVRHAWLVDPLQETLEVLRLEEGRWVLIATYGGDEKVRAEPYDAIELELNVLWGR